MSTSDPSERSGAATGMFAALLFAIGFVLFLTTSPTGATPLPSVNNAQAAPAYLAANLSTVRLETLFNSLALALFLWFVGSLWSVLRRAEGAAGRGAMISVVGATAGAVLMVTGLLLTAAACLSTSPSQAQDAATLYTTSALLFAAGGGVLSVFLFATAKVILESKAAPGWLGICAFIAALLCTLGFVTPFFASGVFDAATGALGRWAWFAAFVVWVFLASLTLTISRRRGAAEDSEAAAGTRIPHQAVVTDEPASPKREETPR